MALRTARSVAAGPAYRILGIDPGSQVTGAAIVEFRGTKGTVVRALSIRLKGTLSARLVALSRAVAELIDTHKPDVAAIENVFLSNNPRSALILGHARCVLVYTLAQTGLPVYEYDATKIKQATLGYGRASKQEIQRLLQMEFGLTRPLPKDASDALAVAYCHQMMHNAPGGPLGKRV